MGRVLLFGRLHDLAGWRERGWPEPPASVSALKAALAAEHAGLGAALGEPCVQVVINGEIVRSDVALGTNDEIAFLPPMSGG